MTGYLLDTNVISETRRLHANSGVIDFLTAVNKDDLYLSALTLGELHKGVEAKQHSDPAGASLLADWVRGIELDFADRILSIDARIAVRWGQLSARQSRPVIDTLIAATALERRLTLVTRNERDFQFTNLGLINPWID